MRGLGLGRLCRAALLLLHAQAALADITIEVNSKGIIWLYTSRPGEDFRQGY